jgi:hypothetical protein
VGADEVEERDRDEQRTGEETSPHGCVFAGVARAPARGTLAGLGGR